MPPVITFSTPIAAVSVLFLVEPRRRLVDLDDRIPLLRDVVVWTFVVPVAVKIVSAARSIKGGGGRCVDAPFRPASHHGCAPGTRFHHFLHSRSIARSLVGEMHRALLVDPTVDLRRDTAREGRKHEKAKEVDSDP
jgi:hypothetical protein